MFDKVVVMAPHDDGFGAFSILARLAGALKQIRPNLGFVFLSGTRSECQLRELGLCPPEAVLVKCHNLIELPKDDAVGGVDTGALAARLPEALAKMDGWRGVADALDWESVGLAISMGVPWLHGVAEERAIPSVEVGDMCWSLVLRGILESGGCLTRELAALLASVAAYERKATEAWLLPFAAPCDYVTHFSQAGVPVNWIPGVFSSQDPEEAVHQALLETWIGDRLPERAVVGIHGGLTCVWRKVIEELRALPPGSQRDVVFTTLGFDSSTRTAGLEVLESRGAKAKVPQMPSLIPLFAAQSLGVTRGGITVLDHIAARCPLAITEEPNHWLSGRQREATLAAGLCFAVDLQAFRGDPRGLAEALLRRTGELTSIRLRMAAVPTGAEIALADYLVRRFL